MKIIKPIITIIVCVCATTLLHAQELKPEIAKPVEDTRSNMPSPVPEFKPQPQATAPTPVKTVEASAPATKKEETKPTQGKTELKIINNADIVIPGGDEGKRILAGNKTNPAGPVIMASTATPPVAPPVIKPALSRTGQQQQ